MWDKLKNIKDSGWYKNNIFLLQKEKIAKYLNNCNYF
jgi:hypothetical protein